MVVKTGIVVAEQFNSNPIVPYEEKDTQAEIFNKSCKLCNSSLREEVEQEFESKRHNISAALNFLKNKGEEISYAAVRNHLHYHYKIKQRHTAIREYGKDVGKWMKGLGDDRTDVIKARIALLDKEAMTLACESDDLPIADKRKSLEIVSKLYSTVEKLERNLLELEKIREPAAIVVNQLQVIIKSEMENIKTVETKKVLVNIIERLRDEVGDFLME
jgi:hypothetical protein